MSTVYVLSWWYEYEGESLVSVHETLAGAQAAADAQSARYTIGPSRGPVPLSWRPEPWADGTQRWTAEVTGSSGLQVEAQELRSP